MGVPPKWMICNGQSHYKWMIQVIQGYPQFRKFPFFYPNGCHFSARCFSLQMARVEQATDRHHRTVEPKLVEFPGLKPRDPSRPGGLLCLKVSRIAEGKVSESQSLQSVGHKKYPRNQRSHIDITIFLGCQVDRTLSTSSADETSEVVGPQKNVGRSKLGTETCVDLPPTPASPANISGSGSILPRAFPMLLYKCCWFIFTNT